MGLAVTRIQVRPGSRQSDRYFLDRGGLANHRPDKMSKMGAVIDS